jgi:hypothetical protein
MLLGLQLRFNSLRWNHFLIIYLIEQVLQDINDEDTDTRTQAEELKVNSKRQEDSLDNSTMIIEPLKSKPTPRKRINAFPDFPEDIDDADHLPLSSDVHVNSPIDPVFFLELSRHH